ncbi:hypothetical protein Taro_028043 [Colocasia esculenta]|uniref:VHS domain-containing protein n=1 Tax=Colocasia esculenta TaxID=4460 RepID=A0A843VJV7_COLES|nr:hypothetical protein [Colocasia esculenta]
MDTSRRAVEAYWRSRMIDGVTSDEDKVAPVYKLDEVCELLRTSHAGIVKEVADYILKRLDHKNPVVKQKTLRLIKFAVGKSGVEFRREMQRHSAVVRQLFHYKGYPDPLKGDALNKAVRDSAHEAVSAIFASDDVKAPTEGIKRRMEGFGNTNFEMPIEDKRSFLSEVVGLGSASIKHGLSTIASAHSFKKNDNGTYRSPNLHRSLTNEMDNRDSYEGNDDRERWTSPVASKNVASASWSQDSSLSMDVTSTNGGTTGEKSREEKLLETIVTSGGVRLQPTRDAIQVRMKAICVLESILRRKDDTYCSTVGSYFMENRDCVIKCSESPQASLREKGSKVLNLLDGESTSGTRQVEESSAKPAPVVPVPDLIDTSGTDDYESEDMTHHQTHESNANIMSTGSLVDDIFGGDSITNITTDGENGKEDPFADVSFHVTEERGKLDDIFSGLTVDEKKPVTESTNPTNSQQSEFLDIFGPPTIHPQETRKTEVHDLIGGLSTGELGQGNKLPGGASGGGISVFNLDAAGGPSLSPANESLGGFVSPQIIGMNQHAFFPMGSMPYTVPQGIMLNQSFASQPINYGAMGSFISQQQLLFQNFGRLNPGIAHASGNADSSPLPDIFQRSNNQVQSHVPTMSSSKEDSRAFDFISNEEKGFVHFRKVQHATSSCTSEISFAHVDAFHGPRHVSTASHHAALVPRHGNASPPPPVLRFLLSVDVRRAEADFLVSEVQRKEVRGGERGKEGVEVTRCRGGALVRRGGRLC